MIGAKMAKEDKGKLPTISTAKTSGLTSTRQLTDTTSNEVFSMTPSTSGTEIIITVPRPMQRRKKL